MADSISLDPHKWLYQPLDCGCLLYRDSAAARRAFSHTGDYAKSLLEDPLESFAFFEESLELSRRFRALKLWLSLRYHGLANFREAVRNDLDCAAISAEQIDEERELELLAPVPLSAVCFRYLAQRGSSGGYRCAEPENSATRGATRTVFLSNATIRGKFALRACVVNHRTTLCDVEEVISEVLAAGKGNFRRRRISKWRYFPRNLSVGERAILTQAPCRADLAGGTMDLWPLYLFHPGAVTVNHRARHLDQLAASRRSRDARSR